MPSLLAAAALAKSSGGSELQCTAFHVQVAGHNAGATADALHQALPAAATAASKAAAAAAEVAAGLEGLVSFE